MRKSLHEVLGKIRPDHKKIDVGKIMGGGIGGGGDSVDGHAREEKDQGKPAKVGACEKKRSTNTKGNAR